MSIPQFKEAHKRFADALKYIVTNEPALKADPVKWAKVQQNFQVKFEKPMDEAWEALTKEERKRMAPLYLFRKAAEDETVKKIISTFDARITGVTEGVS